MQGFNTQFKDQVKVGDCILVEHPTSLVTEDRMVVGIMSQRSLHVDQVFSSDFTTTINFEIRKDSVTLERAALKAQKRSAEEATLEDMLEKQLAKRVKKQKTHFQVREKTGMWGYKNVDKTFKKEPTREELLDMRCKTRHDHWCNI